MVEPNNIYLGDCLDVMRQIKDESIDAIICDLPYNTTRNDWDCIIPFKDLWQQYIRITKDRGAIVLFSQQPFTSMLVMSNLNMFKYEWIWQKDNGTGHLNSHFAPLKKHENILIFSKSAASFVKDVNDAMVFNPQMRTGKPYSIKNGRPSLNYDAVNCRQVVTQSNGERYPIDIVEFNRDKEKFHPTAKPIALCQYLIRTYTNENDVVLDNCMGSGTTCVAAIKERRQYIGIEKDEQYFEIAKKRIEQELSQPTLF